MTPDQRVDVARDNEQKYPWAELVLLFEVDPGKFYTLACDGNQGESSVQFRDELAFLANNVRDAIQTSYEIEQSETGTHLIAASGRSTPIPSDLVSSVTRFLRAIDGKGNSDCSGKDYVGTEISDAEMRFKLGDRSSWENDHAKIAARLTVQPLVFRISDEEIGDLASQPPYVLHGLRNCAAKTVLAPTSVFKGLNRGNDCPADLKTGWAICGKPRRAYDNQGNATPAPAGMVYVVYADESRFVFDWDWVAESPIEPGYPMDWQLRFGNPQPLEQDAVLKLPKELPLATFDATKACYSNHGDCIFCYMTDEVSHADRINADLTVFKSVDHNEYTGFKVKNVQRILENDETIQLTDSPGLAVSVNTVLLATLKRNAGQDGDLRVYDVLIRALLQRTPSPPEVHVPLQSQDLVEA